MTYSGVNGSQNCIRCFGGYTRQADNFAILGNFGNYGNMQCKVKYITTDTFSTSNNKNNKKGERRLKPKFLDLLSENFSWKNS